MLFIQRNAAGRLCWLGWYSTRIVVVFDAAVGVILIIEIEGRDVDSALRKAFISSMLQSLQSYS